MQFNLQHKFRLGFGLIILCVLGVLLVEQRIAVVVNEYSLSQAEANKLERAIQQTNQLLSDFFLLDSQSDSLYAQDFEPTRNKKRELFAIIRTSIESLEKRGNQELWSDSIDALKEEIFAFSTVSDSLISVQSMRGFRDFGKIGLMRDAVHELEQNNSIPLEDILILRRIEKDFLLRQDASYLVRHENKIQTIKASLQENETQNAKTLELLNTYEARFKEVAYYEGLLGSYNEPGLVQQSHFGMQSILKRIDQLILQKKEFHEYRVMRLQYLKAILFALTAGLILFFGLLFQYQFIGPLQWVTDYFITKRSSNNELNDEGQRIFALHNEVGATARTLSEQLNHLDNQKEKLAHAVIDAQEANRVKSEFLSTMSHEIRTPLNAVVNIISDLSESDQVNDSHREDIEILKSSTEYLLALVNDVLDLNKLDEGKLRLNPQAVDFHLLLKTISHIFRNRFASKKVVFETDYEIENIQQWLKLDKVRLNQVLFNILGNALKFTHEGYVRLKIRTLQTNGQISLIQFSIEDSGIGIEKSQARKIFDRFSQADSSNQRNYSGSGLGLSISQSLVELMGGKIQLESEPNKGSRFFFELKIPHAEAIVNNTEQVLGSKQGSYQNEDINVLIVDDNKVNLRVASKIVKRAGYSMQTAENGEIAIEMAKKERFHVILMDLQMPVMDGFKATKAIRLIDSHYSKIPIIAVSASSLVESQDQAYLAGMNDFIGKPFRPDEFLSCIERNLESPGVLTPVEA